MILVSLHTTYSPHAEKLDFLQKSTPHYKAAQEAILTLEQALLRHKNNSQPVHLIQQEEKILPLLSLSPIFPKEFIKNHLFNTIVHIALKSYQDPETYPLQKKYERTHAAHHGFYKLKAIEKLVRQTFQDSYPEICTLQQKQGLLRIFQHRYNYFNYLVMLASPPICDYSKKVETIVDKVIFDIEALDDPQSLQVTYLENGDTCFVLPSIWTWDAVQNFSHLTNFEFRKDSADRYFFILYNRQLSCKKLGGSISFKKGGKCHRRTCTTIQTSKEALQNPQFISLLVRASLQVEQFSPQEVYDIIYHYLIENNEGCPIQSSIETSAQALLQSGKNLDSLLQKKIVEVAEQAVLFDAAFHSRQLFHTCVESSATLAEKNMAPPSVRRVLKKHTLNFLLKDIKQQYILPLNLKSRTVWTLIAKLKSDLQPPDIKYVENLEKTLLYLTYVEKQVIKNKKTMQSLEEPCEEMPSKLALNDQMMANAKQKLKRSEKLLQKLIASIEKQLSHLQILLEKSFLYPLLLEIKLHLIENREAKTLKAHVEKQIKKLNNKLRNPPQKDVAKTLDLIGQLKLELAKKIFKNF
jgi:hypothetical protein